MRLSGVLRASLREAFVDTINGDMLAIDLLKNVSALPMETSITLCDTETIGDTTYSNISFFLKREKSGFVTITFHYTIKYMKEVGGYTESTGGHAWHDVTAALNDGEIVSLDNHISGHCILVTNMGNKYVLTYNGSITYYDTIEQIVKDMKSLAPFAYQWQWQY